MVVPLDGFERLVVKSNVKIYQEVFMSSDARDLVVIALVTMPTNIVSVAEKSECMSFTRLIAVSYIYMWRWTLETTKYS